MPSSTERKLIIIDFLNRCNAYAEDQLSNYQVAVNETPPAQALALQDKIGHWSAYLAFNLHAIDELQAGKLDDWLVDQAGPADRNPKP